MTDIAFPGYAHSSVHRPHTPSVCTRTAVPRNQAHVLYNRVNVANSRMCRSEYAVKKNRTFSPSQRSHFKGFTFAFASPPTVLQENGENEEEENRAGWPKNHARVVNVCRLYMYSMYVFEIYIYVEYNTYHHMAIEKLRPA